MKEIHSKLTDFKILKKLLNRASIFFMSLIYAGYKIN